MALQEQIAQAKKDGKSADDLYAELSSLGHKISRRHFDDVFSAPDLKVAKKAVAKKAKIAKKVKKK